MPGVPIRDVAEHTTRSFGNGRRRISRLQEYLRTRLVAQAGAATVDEVLDRAWRAARQPGAAVDGGPDSADRS